MEVTPGRRPISKRVPFDLRCLDRDRLDFPRPTAERLPGPNQKVKRVSAVIVTQAPYTLSCLKFISS